MLLDQCDWYAYQKRKFGHTHTHKLIHTEREHMWKRRWRSGWGSRSQGTAKIVIKYYPVTKKNIKASFPLQPSEGTREPTLLIPQFQISRLQKCDTSNFCYLCHPVSGTFFMASLGNSWASLRAHLVKNLPAMQETGVQFLGQEDALEKEMATHSSILAWWIPWTEEPGGLQSMRSQRVRHDIATKRERGNSYR